MSNRIVLAFQDFVSGSICNANDYYFESFNSVKNWIWFEFSNTV